MPTRTRPSDTISSTCMEYYDIPLCLVDGFMSPFSLDVFQNFLIELRISLAKNDQPCPRILRSYGCGAVSCYDNVMDLFYQIKGGRVDYGELHAKRHGHSRFGKLYTSGHYEAWSEANPINFLTHSFGGNVVLLLQTLLEQQLFYDLEGNKYDTNANWVRSLTTVSSPLRGSLCNYYLGQHPFKPHLLSPFSFKKMIYLGCYLWEYFDSPLLKQCTLLDFKASHFNISYKDISFFQLIQNIFSNQALDLGLDTASYDLSVERYLTKSTKSYSNTYYRSYATTLSEPINNSYETDLTSIQHWCLCLVSVATKTGNSDLQIYPQLDKKDGLGWKSNDGMCSLISQFHPEPCSKPHCQHTQLNEMDQFKAGKWYTTTINNCSHVDLVPGVHPPPKLINLILKLLNWSKFTRITASQTFWDKNYLENTLVEVVQDYTNFLTTTGKSSSK